MTSMGIGTTLAKMHIVFTEINFIFWLTGFWHVYNCGFQHYLICKRSGTPPANATVVPTVPQRGGCPQNWKKFNSKCYNIINSQRETWEAARTKCRTMGGNLASILSRYDQVFLSAELAKAPTTDLWIGLHNQHGIRFYWTDGRPMRYNNWGTESRRSVRVREHHFKRKECAVMNTDPGIGRGKWIPMSCNDTNGYVCLQNLDPSLPDSPEPTVTMEYVKLFNDSVKVVIQPMNWETAQKHCRSDDANLASLRNEWSEIYAELMALNLNSSLWIGLKKQKTSGYFTYVDGWHMTLSNWGSREPSMDRHCVYVDVDGKWKTADCNQNMNSLCMKSTDVPPTESSDFPGLCPEDPEITRYGRHRSTWIPFKGHCYLFLTASTEWPDASATCERHGATLASIEDPSEQQFIQNNVNKYQDSEPSFWIGLYKTHSGVWKWLDNTVIDYSNWDVNQPSAGEYGTIETSDGKWTSSRRWPNRGYICKIAKVLQDPPPTTVSPTVDLQTHGHIILPVVLVITAIAIGIFIIFVFKRSGHQLLTNSENPPVSSNERFPSDLVDANKLVANAEEENPEPVVML